MKRLSEINYVLFCSFMNLTLNKLFTHILILNLHDIYFRRKKNILGIKNYEDLSYFYFLF